MEGSWGASRAQAGPGTGVGAISYSGEPWDVGKGAYHSRAEPEGRSGLGRSLGYSNPEGQRGGRPELGRSLERGILGGGGGGGPWPEGARGAVGRASRARAERGGGRPGLVRRLGSGGGRPEIMRSLGSGDIPGWCRA
ncbi:rRNA 2'-O-methyltransferase fibrillarin-like [Capsicum annuum]|uniref:rRNA 2'-O-methyltransferase fibrillarin-like n=1 Tax=Capsicum annuum TaxID=4072 RepID=UPI001FB064B6|nr:rRNA 2'-O-methyltransferase fibrillarin-like [Capsicum annuum]